MATFLSSRQFNQDTSEAKRAASANGPVYISDRGKPAHVLLSISDFEKLSGKKMSLYEALLPDDDQDFDFEPPRLSGSLKAPVDFG
jgi:prevent-host-death family protein